MAPATKTSALAASLLLSLGFGGSALAAGGLPTEISLQYARFVNAALHSSQGDENAARQLAASAGIIDAALSVAIRGGQYQNCTYAPAPQGAQPRMVNVLQSWKYYQHLGEAIQQNQPAMQRYTDGALSLSKNTPDRLELAEQVAILIAMQGNSPLTNVAAGGQLEMLSVRINNSANILRLETSVNPEAAFLLGKDTNTFRDIDQALLNGSKVLRTTPVKGDVRAKLSQLDKVLDKDIEARDAVLNNLKPAITVKNAAAEIDGRSEEFLHQIQLLAAVLPSAQDCR